jgi:hypothetical protein
MQFLTIHPRMQTGFHRDPHMQIFAYGALDYPNLHLHTMTIGMRLMTGLSPYAYGDSWHDSHMHTGI